MKKNILILSIFVIVLFSSCNIFFNPSNSNNTNTADTTDDTSDLNNTQDGDAFVYAGNRYKGKTSDGTGEPLKYEDKSIKITKPSVKSFNADAYFELEGECTNSKVYKYVFVTVSKDDKETHYLLRNKFKQKIWLRFGKGEYKIQVMKITGIKVDLYGQGDISDFRYQIPAVYEFTVNNTRDEDGTFFYPSDPIQSDSKEIYDLAVKLTKNKSNNKQKIKAIHDYVIDNLQYDTDSLNTERRKKQDAISTLQNKTAVCEGYTSLMTAMLRSLGYRTKAIAGRAKQEKSTTWIGHAWVEVYANAGWKFIDPTWDDPIVNGDPANPVPYEYKYRYFYLNKTPADHKKDSDRIKRNIDNSQAEFKGYPNGWY